MRCWKYCIIFLAMTSTAIALTVDPPQKVKINKLDRSELAGMITSFDENGFELMDANKKSQTVAWDELPADAVMTLHDRLVRKRNAEGWVKVGEKHLSMPRGRRRAGEAVWQAAY